jgi:hypothetical protein
MSGLRSFLLAVAICAAMIFAAVPAHAQTVSVNTINRVTITATLVTVPANTSTPLIVANPTRKSLVFVNVGAYNSASPPDVNINPAASASSVNGIPLGVNSPVGNAYSWGAGEGVPTNAFSVFSTSGTTILILEGN